MAEIFRNRTIRPSSRLVSSKNYKVDVEKVRMEDTLLVTIDHESNPFRKTFTFRGEDVAHRNNISFTVQNQGNKIEIIWKGAKPIDFSNIYSIASKETKDLKKISENIQSVNSLAALKKSFDPISDSDTSILILGTMPGDKSIQANEYYGHPRNRFWKIMAFITNVNEPLTYLDKKNLLFKAKIGLWDVAHKAHRKGSLDNAIKNEKPNDLEEFILKHKNLKVIGFNGAKAETLFNKYFKRKKEIRYICLPSTSPANTNINLDNICIEWQKVLIK